MKTIETINGISIEVVSHRDTWAVSNKQVAEAFAVTVDATRQHKSRSELKEGVHFYMSQNATGNAVMTFWTKKAKES